jgi:hypothetical protein
MSGNKPTATPIAVAVPMCVQHSAAAPVPASAPESESTGDRLHSELPTMDQKSPPLHYIYLQLMQVALKYLP